MSSANTRKPETHLPFPKPWQDSGAPLMAPSVCGYAPRRCRATVVRPRPAPPVGQVHDDEADARTSPAIPYRAGASRLLKPQSDSGRERPRCPAWPGRAKAARRRSRPCTRPADQTRIGETAPRPGAGCSCRIAPRSGSIRPSPSTRGHRQAAGRPVGQHRRESCCREVPGSGARFRRWSNSTRRGAGPASPIGYAMTEPRTSFNILSRY